MISAHELLQKKTEELVAEAREALRHGAHLERHGSNGASSSVTNADATSTPDPSRDPAEAVHDLRVAIRRLRSVLRPMRLVYGKKALKKTEAILVEALDVTSDLRDEEVLRETLQKLELAPAERERLSVWMVGRARRERGLRSRAIRALVDDAREGEKAIPIEGGLDRLENKVGRAPETAIDFSVFRHEAMREAVEDLEARLAASAIEDAHAMHRVRIGAKRLRYVAELIADLVERPERVIDAVILTPAVDARPDNGEIAALRRIEKGCERIQKRLGTLHDLDEALLRMGRAWGLDRVPRQAVIDALRKERARLAKKSLNELDQELRAMRAALPHAEPRPAPEPPGEEQLATEPLPES